MERTRDIKAREWFIESPSKTDRFRLFVFHHAGGGATYYRPLLKEIDEEVTVYLIQLPGREYRMNEFSYDNLEELMKPLIEAIMPYLDRPFAFFGHSMGAMIALELTYQLEAYYQLSPKHLFLSALKVPHLEKEKAYHALPDEELLTNIFDLGGTQVEVSKESKLMSLMLPILRKDLKLCETHQFKKREAVDIPVTILGGNQDKVIDVGEFVEWEGYFKNRFEICIFEGNHFYFKHAYALLGELLMQRIQQSYG